MRSERSAHCANGKLRDILIQLYLIDSIRLFYSFEDLQMLVMPACG